VSLPVSEVTGYDIIRTLLNPTRHTDERQVNSAKYFEIFRYSFTANEYFISKIQTFVETATNTLFKENDFGFRNT
jgi:hypothetical protein